MVWWRGEGRKEVKHRGELPPLFHDGDETRKIPDTLEAYGQEAHEYVVRPTDRVAQGQEPSEEPNTEEPTSSPETALHVSPSISNVPEETE